MNQLSFYLGGLRASGKDQRLPSKLKEVPRGVLAEYGVELRPGAKDFAVPGALGQLRLAFFRSVWGGDEAIARLSAAGVTLDQLLPDWLFAEHPDAEAIIRGAIADEGGEKGGVSAIDSAFKAAVDKMGPEAALRQAAGRRGGKAAIGFKELILEAVEAGVKAAREEARPQSKRQGDVLAESIAAHLRPYLSNVEWRNN